MLILRRRMSRSRSPGSVITSSPSIKISPAVGSWSRLIMRTSVDFPEPERPITTKTSPWPTSNETSRTAATQPVLSRSSARGNSASGEPTIRSGCGPYTFQTDRQETVASALFTHTPPARRPNPIILGRRGRGRKTGVAAGRTRPQAGDAPGEAHFDHGIDALRLRDRRRRVRRVRAGQPPVDRPFDPGARLGGRPARLSLGRLHPHAGGTHVPDRQPLLRLEVRIRTRTPYAGPPDLPRTRQGPRRLEQHQRDDLPAREPPRLRAMGLGPRDADMGLRALPPVLPPHGAMPRRPTGRPVPRRRRPPRARTRPGHQSAVRRVLRGGASGGLRADRRRERLPAGGVRGVRPEHPPRPPAVGGGGLPAPGEVAPEPGGPNAHVRDADPVRGLARRRGRDRPRPRRDRADPRGRGRRVRRRDQLAADAAALGRRPGRGA